MLLTYLVHHFGKVVKCRNYFFIAFAKSKILRPKKKRARCYGMLGNSPPQPHPPNHPPHQLPFFS